MVVDVMKILLRNCDRHDAEAKVYGHVAVTQTIL